MNKEQLETAIRDMERESPGFAEQLRKLSPEKAIEKILVIRSYQLGKMLGGSKK